MAYTQADIDALDRMMAADDIQECRFEDGRMVRKRDIVDSLALRRVMVAEVRMTAMAGSGVSRRGYFGYGRGT